MFIIGNGNKINNIDIKYLFLFINEVFQIRDGEIRGIPRNTTTPDVFAFICDVCEMKSAKSSEKG